MSNLEFLITTFSLQNEDVVALKRQGFVSTEYRGHRGPFFKLRFRSGPEASQRVIYLGKDSDVANQVRAALVDLRLLASLRSARYRKGLPVSRISTKE